MLLYASAGEPIDLRYRLGGFPVRVCTLNLEQHWHGVRRELLGLFPAGEPVEVDD